VLVLCCFVNWIMLGLFCLVSIKVLFQLKTRICFILLNLVSFIWCITTLVISWLVVDIAYLCHWTFQLFFSVLYCLFYVLLEITHFIKQVSLLCTWLLLYQRIVIRQFLLLNNFVASEHHFAFLTYLHCSIHSHAYPSNLLFIDVCLTALNSHYHVVNFCRCTCCCCCCNHLYN